MLHTLVLLPKDECTTKKNHSKPILNTALSWQEHRVRPSREARACHQVTKASQLIPSWPDGPTGEVGERTLGRETIVFPAKGAPVIWGPSATRMCDDLRLQRQTEAANFNISWSEVQFGGRWAWKYVKQTLPVPLPDAVITNPNIDLKKQNCS